MKTRYLWLGLLSAMAVSCTMTEISSPDEFDTIPSGKSAYYAVIDEQQPIDDNETKTYSDESLRVRWMHDDRVTIFEDVTYGRELFFMGKDGATGGGFDYVSSSSRPPYYGGEDLGGMKYAIYPHSSDTEIDSDGTLTYILPATQYYREKSFGEGANVMVAETEENSDILKFKNVGGYLSFKLYGDNVSVSSVILKSVGGEPLSGEGAIKMVDGLPKIEMNTDTDKSSDEVRIFCKDAVIIGDSEETATEFRFVLPPMAFSSEGVTLTVATSDGGIFSLTGLKSRKINRNKVLNVSPIEVIPDSGSNITIKEISSNAGGYGVEGKLGANYTNKATYDSATQTFDITLPTVTDFSAEVFNITLTLSDDVLFVGDEEITPADPSKPKELKACIDASSPATLTVRRGEREKKFTLNAHNTGLPVVRITTEGFTLEQLEKYMNSLQNEDGVDDEHPYGTDYRRWLPDEDTGMVMLPDENGRVSEESTPGSVIVRIEKADGTPGMNNGSSFEVESQIKGRGNYSWLWEKKPYALKFSSKTEVLGMPKHKRWILLANWRDRTLLRNDAAFYLSRAAAPEIPYTVRGQFVELEFNGEHRGNYYLCEQIKIDENRVNISETKSKNGVINSTNGGFLMEIDSYWDELNKFHSKYFNLNYMFKEPDEDETKKPEFAPAYDWMENYVNEFERVLKTKSSYTKADDEETKPYENYLDVNSAIMFMMINELTGNRDFYQGPPHTGPHSTYLYKDAGEDAKLFMGPVWDFDYETFIAESYIDQNSENGWRGFKRTGYYYHFLCYDQDFVDQVKSLWSSKKAAFEGLTGYIDQKVAEISASQKYDEILWPYKPGDSSQNNRNDNHDYYNTKTRKVIPFDTAIATMKDNFNARVTWMENQIIGKGTTQYPGLKRTSPTFLYETPADWSD